MNLLYGSAESPCRILPTWSLLLILLWTGGCESQSVRAQVDGQPDRQELLVDLERFSSDEFEGRRTGSEGNRMARRMIADRFKSLGVDTVAGGRFQEFSHTHPGTGELFSEAANVIGRVEGTRNPDLYLVVTAHYDHLGVENGEIYNGADDNASGTAALLALARFLTENPPQHSILLVATDAEEQGLGGAWHFVQNPPVPLEQVVLNLNMDMISHSPEGVLYAAGTWHSPFLKPVVEEALPDDGVEVRFGFDHEGEPQDWTMASDHGPFHQSGVPFLYFGVEDHIHYHEPTDTFDNIHPDFYVDAVRTIFHVVIELDSRLDELHLSSGREAESPS